MIKILHFITDTNIGGAGKLLFNQIKSINTKVFRIYVALPSSSALISQLEDLPCTIIKCEYMSDRSISINGIIESFAIIKKIKPDIVHSHASLSSRISSSLLSVPSRITTKHCAFPLPEYMKFPIVKKFIYFSNSLLSTKIIAVASTAKEDLINIGIDQKMIVTVINGVERVRTIGENEKQFIKNLESV